MTKENIECQIQSLFQELGFQKVILNNQQIYKWSNNYYKITFIHKFQAYIIEFASTVEEAEKNLFEDSDLYPLSLGERLVEQLHSDLTKYYKNK